MLVQNIYGHNMSVVFNNQPCLIHNYSKLQILLLKWTLFWYTFYFFKWVRLGTSDLVQRFTMQHLDFLMVIVTWPYLVLYFSVVV